MNAFDVGYNSFMQALEKRAGLLETLDDLSAKASRLSINSDKRNDELDSKLDQLIALSRQQAGLGNPQEDNYKLKFIGADPGAKKLIKKKRRVLEATLKDIMREDDEDLE